MMNDLNKRIDLIISKTRAELLSTEMVYKDNFINLLVESYNLPNGKIIKRDRVVKNNNKEAVIIIAETVSNKYLVVVQNRIDEITSVEFPSGYVEDDENILDAAQRELLEETGYYSSNIAMLDKLYTQLGIDSGTINIVLAKDCVKVSCQNLGDSEYINYMELTFLELKELVDNNIINSSLNKLAFYDLVNEKNSKKLILK